MPLELIQHLNIATCAMATLAWISVSLIQPHALLMAITSAGILLATCLLRSAPVSNRCPRDVPSHKSSRAPMSPVRSTYRARTYLAASAWILSAICLITALLFYKRNWTELAVFSPAALLVCWLAVIPLLIQRIHQRA